MRLTIRGDYASDWRAVADGIKADCDYRCARCHHRYCRGDDPRQHDDRCTHRSFEPKPKTRRR